MADLESKRIILKPKKPNGFEENQMDAKKPDNDNEDEGDNDDDNEDEDTNLLSNNEVEELQKIIIETLGSTNLTVIQEAISYLDTFPLEVIKEALVRAARKQKKWDYARGTLNNWIENGLDTLEKIKANDLEFKSNNQAAKQAGKKLEQREYSEEDFNRLYANKKE